MSVRPNSVRPPGMTDAEVDRATRIALYDYTRLGAFYVSIFGVTWIRQSSGWAKQFAWANDPHGSYRWDEIVRGWKGP